MENFLKRLKEKKLRSADPQFESDVEIFFANQHRVRSLYWLLMSTLVLSSLAIVGSLLTYTSVKNNDKADEHRAQVARVEIIKLSRDNNELLNVIRGCLDPKAPCGKRGSDSAKNAGTAITYCTLNLPKDAVRDVVSACIIRELSREIAR
jgi:hypothetical protein